MDVLVIGGGIVGTSAALELARRGARVTVVDKGALGHGCSYGNAGWLTPCFATPLPAPGVLTTSLKWLLDPESPLYIKPSWSVEWLVWLAGFARSCTKARFESGVAALSSLSQASLEAYEALAAEYPGTFGFTRRGLIQVAETDNGLEHARHDASIVARHGVAFEVLDAKGVKTLEPSVVGPVRGGVFYPGEAHVEPLAATLALARAAQGAGARFVTGAEVFDATMRGDRVVSVHTTRGVFAAERFVLATGSWSKALGARLGFRLPVLGGKGYAITVRTFDPAPTRPVKIVERRVAVTPREGSVRLAGTLELVDGDESVSPRRVAAIVRGARGVLAVPDDPEVIEIWRGLRPCTPDGLPAIGPARGLDNVFVATGHQMCGLHTAPATGRLVAELVTGASPSFDPRPFRPSRF